MATETERKFLLHNDQWRELVSAKREISQGYLNSHPERTVRVRISNGRGMITIKGKSEGISRAEYEYEIPIKEAEALLVLCEKPIIEKTRYLVGFEDKTWEIDEFYGDNLGLIIAEVELENEEEKIELPDWIGNEVSHDRKYFNSALIKQPYTQWTAMEKQID